MSSTERAARGRADLAAGRVMHVDGQIALEQTGLAEQGFRFQSRAAHIVWNDDLFPKPLPGRWRVYALPASGIVVGAEAFGVGPGAAGLPGPEQLFAYGTLLAAAQGLGSSDFEQLRAGRLTLATQSRVTQAVRRGGALSAALVVASALFVALGWVVDVPVLLDVEGFPIGVTALASPLCWIHAVRLLLRSRTMHRGVRGTIRRVQGVGRGEKMRVGRTVLYVVEIGGERFRSSEHPVAADVWHVVASGHPLRGYVADGASLLVAVEPGSYPAPRDAGVAVG